MSEEKSILTKMVESLTHLLEEGEGESPQADTQPAHIANYTTADGRRYAILCTMSAITTEGLEDG